MKQIVGIFLLLLMMSLTFKDLITVAHFYLNQTYIEDNLCVNQDRPELMCHGMCFLNKSIQESHEQEKDIPNPVKENLTNIVYLSISQLFEITEYTISDSIELNYFFAGPISHGHLSDIFHPPKFRA